MRLRELVPHLYRVPLAQPVVTSFGTMRMPPLVERRITQ